MLIADRHMFRRRLDSKMTRSLSACPLLFNVGERTFACIDAEEHRSIVPAIGSIQVFSGRVYSDFRSTVGAIIRWRQSGDGLPNRQDSGLRIVGKSVQR